MGDRVHPELVDLQEKQILLAATSKAVLQSLRNELAEIVRHFKTHFNEGYTNEMRKEVENIVQELSSPLKIIGVVEAATTDIKTLFEKSKEEGSHFLSDKDSTSLIDRHSTILRRLVCIRPDKDSADNRGYKTTLPCIQPGYNKETNAFRGMQKKQQSVFFTFEISLVKC